MGANDRQVGGSHYRSGLQHWDVCTDHRVGYLESAATKYLTRFRGKNGRKDVEKSAHYVEKLLEKTMTGEEHPVWEHGVVPYDVINQFFTENKVDDPQVCNAITLIFRWRSLADLRGAIRSINLALSGPLFK